MTGLLDSGAAVTILGDNSHLRLLATGLTLLDNDLPNKFVAAGGQMMSAIGYINLPVTFENNFHIIKAYVIPSVKSSLILDVDFWRKFKLCPKFRIS